MTGVLADRLPPQLHLFRTYVTKDDTNQSIEQPTTDSSFYCPDTPQSKCTYFLLDSSCKISEIKKKQISELDVIVLFRKLSMYNHSWKKNSFVYQWILQNISVNTESLNQFIKCINCYILHIVKKQAYLFFQYCAKWNIEFWVFFFF